mgnify:CR=1 FL=1
MTDARQSERTRSLLRAQAIFNKGSSTIDCLIKNISPDGARLSIDEYMTIPVEFDLEVPQRGRTFRARIVWRGEGAMGVMFIQPEAETNVQPLPRLKELERENAMLKVRVRMLSDRLQDLGQDIV